VWIGIHNKKNYKQWSADDSQQKNYKQWSANDPQRKNYKPWADNDLQQKNNKPPNKESMITSTKKEVTKPAPPEKSSNETKGRKPGAMYKIDGQSQKKTELERN